MFVFDTEAFVLNVNDGAPILTLPRMMAEFHMGAITGFDVRVLADAGDPLAMAGDVLTALGIPASASIADE